MEADCLESRPSAPERRRELPGKGKGRSGQISDAAKQGETDFLISFESWRWLRGALSSSRLGFIKLGDRGKEARAVPLQFHWTYPANIL
jgi:hypothetical protein